MKIGFLFPGQGTDLWHSCQEMAEHKPGIRDLLTLAARSVALDLPALFERAGRRLEATEVFQPVLTALVLGIAQELVATRIRPSLVAGHSLGEIAAWSAAGGIGPAKAIELAALRGRLMAGQAAQKPGGMLALINCDRDSVEAALALGQTHGSVQLAAINAPDEWVLSGDQTALRSIAAVHQSVSLATAGQWHGQAMAGAVEELRQAMKQVPQSPPSAVLVTNRSGQAVENPEQIPDLLAEQLVHPVHWAKTMQNMAQAGVSDLITIGPGKVLRGLVRKNRLAGVELHSTQTLDDLKTTMEGLGQ